MWVGDEDASPCPAGKTGELIICGEQVSPGYLDSSQGGFFTHRGDCTYRTGDFGVTRDGYLYCLGRKDRQIKHMGHRIEPLEIELALAQETGVGHAAVLLHRGRLTAVIQPDSGTPPDKAALRRSLQERLAPYMMPDTFLFITDMPLSKNGKCDYKKLRELIADG